MNNNLSNPKTHVFLKMINTFGNLFVWTSFIFIASSIKFLEKNSLNKNEIFILSIIFSLVGTCFIIIFIILRFFVAFKKLNFKFNKGERKCNYIWVSILILFVLFSIINAILFKEIEINKYKQSHVNWIMLGIFTPFPIISSIIETKSKFRQIKYISELWNKTEKDKNISDSIKPIKKQKIQVENDLIEGEIKKKDKEEVND